MSSPEECESYREMACFLCGYHWTVTGEVMSTRPPCPECGGCRTEGNLHLGEVYRRALKDGGEVSGMVTGAMFPPDGECPEESVCTTAARDTLGMAYDERALMLAGYIPDWHPREG